MSTWGQLRLVTQTLAPGVSLDLIDEALNEAYTFVLQATDWTGLKAHAMIQTVAAYQSPTNPPSPPSESVTVTVGSASVTGAGTAWTSGVVGRQFYRAGDNVVYTVAAFVSATSLTLDRPYEGLGYETPGTAYAGASYVFMTDIYTLPSDVRSPVTVINPVTGHPLNEMTKESMDASRGTRATVGNPWAFCVYDDTPEASPPVLHRIQFYAPPQYSRGYEIEYLRNANYFTGQNTSASPLPFVTDAAILDRALARIFLGLGDKRAAGYVASAEGELNKMLLVEHTQTRPISRMHMAARYTRHRLARVDRQYGRNWGRNQGTAN